MRNGPVGTYEKHALVLVHHGGGTGQKLVQLANEIAGKVEAMFDVKLEAEVRGID